MTQLHTSSQDCDTPASRVPKLVTRCVAIAAGLLASPAQASFLKGDTLDAAANVLAWIVIVLVPIIGIAVFWIVHVMPEKIAHKRHHPQRQAIQTLCLLSLVFGGLLWPIAWLWAFTRPVGYKMAYGTDKHEDYFEEAHKKLRSGMMSSDELRHVHQELLSVRERGPLPPEQRKLLEEVEQALATLEPRATAGSA